MTTLPTGPEDFNKVATSALGTIIVGASIAYNRYIAWRRKNKVDESSNVLDLSSLDSARKQLENQSNELQRIREDSAAAADLAQKRMDALQARIDALNGQLDVEMAKRRSLEDINTRLRQQIVELGAQPVA